MTIQSIHLTDVDQHWAVQAVGKDGREEGLKQSDECLVETSLQNIISSPRKASKGFDFNLIERLALAYEVAAVEGIESLLHPANSEDSQKLQIQALAAAHRAFGLRRVLPISNEKPESYIFHVLHLGGLGYCGDRWPDLRRWLEENSINNLIHEKFSLTADNTWDQHLLYELYDAWVRLLRKKGWDDLDHIGTIIISLRKQQKQFEKNYLNETENNNQSRALRLVALYHWAKATERLAEYMLQGKPASINSELDQHFEAACKAAQKTQDYQFETILYCLHIASRRMVSGSYWWVAHTVNSRVTRHVEQITKNKGMFELLSPQRVALQEGGLLNQAYRAVVVDMPTSGGKTALAQLRILQALNQFGQDDGWVVYVAPTRALVAQITRRLREDFSPLGIKVEMLSGAIEIDAFEETLLEQERAFQVLVVTPEKLQIVIRNKKIIRPLALVVMDEAHNIEDESRGLRIELLLTTIKQESSYANFLLLMPYVPNAKDLAHWLGDGRGTAISLSTTAWQPNDRIIGMFNAKRYLSEKKNDWVLNFETLTTTQNSISLRGKHQVGGVRPLKSSYSQMNSLSLAGAMAKVFSEKGTSIAVTQTIPHAWSLARKLCKEISIEKNPHEDITLVQRFLETEISPDFELIDMLSKGIAVHHAGLPAEVLSLIEWLTEREHIKILCATTTIAQGLNFPVSSIFLATNKYPYGIEMSHRAFWNLAGRAGRVQHGSVGVVGIAAGKNSNAIRQFVNTATKSLISRLISLLDDLEKNEDSFDLSKVIHQEQWTDFRSYIAHLWNETKNLDKVIANAEQLLRGTYGYSSLRGKTDASSKAKADAVLKVTKNYIMELAEHPENASLADTTGFSPEGVRTALLGLNQLEKKLQVNDWQPDSLFGNNSTSVLSKLIGIMMNVPQLQKGFEDMKGNSNEQGMNIAAITQAWVAGKTIKEIATKYFQGSDTAQISKACKLVYRDLTNYGAWGISALSKMPTSGLNFNEMPEEQKRQINNLPAMLYHGVRSEEGILMRMNSVPRSIAEQLGKEFKHSEKRLSTTLASDFLISLKITDWERAKPKGATLSGEDYRKIWKNLSGL
jgi:replicative superfamily II helicase